MHWTRRLLGLREFKTFLGAVPEKVPLRFHRPHCERCVCIAEINSFVREAAKILSERIGTASDTPFRHLLTYIAKIERKEKGLELRRESQLPILPKQISVSGVLAGIVLIFGITPRTSR